MAKAFSDLDIYDAKSFLRIDYDLDDMFIEMALDSANEVESLYKPVYQKDGNEIALMDRLEEREVQEEKIINRMLLKQLLESLEKEERQLIYLRYFANKTQTEVGKKLGISQVQVSRMEKKILKNFSLTITRIFVSKLLMILMSIHSICLWVLWSRRL